MRFTIHVRFNSHHTKDSQQKSVTKTIANSLPCLSHRRARSSAQRAAPLPGCGAHARAPSHRTREGAGAPPARTYAQSRPCRSAGLPRCRAVGAAALLCLASGSQAPPRGLRHTSGLQAPALRRTSRPRAPPRGLRHASGCRRLYVSGPHAAATHLRPGMRREEIRLEKKE
jgi:hypothetical protein